MKIQSLQNRLWEIKIFERAKNGNARMKTVAAERASVQLGTRKAPEKTNVIDIVSEIFYYQKILARTYKVSWVVCGGKKAKENRYIGN